jgi:hypothetical protein
MVEKLCGTCKFRNERGMCKSEKLEELIKDLLIYSYSEGGGFWVGEKFGCVHWAKKEG